MVEKKHIKFGIAALAVTAIVIGLSVGITQSQKNKNAVVSNSVSASLAEYGTYDESCEYESSYGGKSGKSGSSGNSGSGSGSGKSGKSGDRRALYVPGTLEAFGDTIKGLDMNQRRKLRNTLANDFDDRRLGPSSDGSGDGSGKSGKSSSEYSSDGDGSGKSKSGKSGGYGSSECKSHYKDTCKTHGSGKSGKSGGYSSDSGDGSGKSSKSSPTTCGSYDGQDVPELLPPIEELDECVCELSAWKLIEGTCVRDCDAESEDEFSTEEECCMMAPDGCDIVKDSCPPFEELTTPAPTPLFEELTDGTYPPTSGGTTTVATEKTGMPTVEGEPRQ